MYADPSKIREHVVKLRFNEQESALINALVNYTGEQKAALLRSLILEHAARDLGLHPAEPGRQAEGPQLSLLNAS